MKFMLFPQGKWGGKTKDQTHIQYKYEAWSNIKQGLTVILHVSLYAPVSHMLRTKLTGNPLASKCNYAALARLSRQVIKTDDSENSSVSFTWLKTTPALMFIFNVDFKDSARAFLPIKHMYASMWYLILWVCYNRWREDCDMETIRI